MVELSADKILIMSRGDNIVIPLFLNAGSDLKPIRYTLQDTYLDGQVIATDEVYFAILQPNQKFEDAIIKKKYTKANLNKDGDVVIAIAHEDTSSLNPGKYFYEIKSRFIKRVDVDDNTYGVFLAYKDGNFEEKILPSQYESGVNYFSVIVNTVVPRRPLFIEE